MRGQDLRYRLDVDFLDAVNGAKKRVTMPDGRSLELTVPAGLEDGQTLRLRGQGEPGVGGAPAGDVYVEVNVKPHAVFERKGRDIYVETPISLREAVLGGKITVQTIAGDVAVAVPKNTSSGAVLRLKKRGVSPASGAGGRSICQVADRFTRWRRSGAGTIRARVEGRRATERTRRSGKRLKRLRSWFRLKTGL